MKKLLLLLIALAFAFAGWQWLTFPDVAKLRDRAPETTAFMELRKKQLRSEGKDDTIEYRWVPYGSISRNFRRAVLVAEDGAFYEHEGVDIEGVKEALRKDWKKKRFSAGGSTITQQLAKNLYLSPSRNPWRKVKEYLIARALERELSKKRILEIYMNVVELGPSTYGAEAAARHYFGKPAASLSPSEAALLAGSLPNPRVMSPANPNRRLRARQRMILSRMRRWGGIFETEALTERKAKAKGPETPVVPDTDLQPEELTSTAEVAETDTVATDTTAVTGTTDTAPPPETETSGTTEPAPEAPPETQTQT